MLYVHFLKVKKIISKDMCIRIKWWECFKSQKEIWLIFDKGKISAIQIKPIKNP